MFSSSGFKSKMDKALFADSAATSIGAIFGTSIQLLCRSAAGKVQEAVQDSQALLYPYASLSVHFSLHSSVPFLVQQLLPLS